MNAKSTQHQPNQQKPPRVQIAVDLPERVAAWCRTIVVRSADPILCADLYAWLMAAGVQSAQLLAIPADLDVGDLRRLYNAQAETIHGYREQLTEARQRIEHLERAHETLQGQAERAKKVADQLAHQLAFADGT